ncbi:MAG: hypothetical protein RLY86_965 [Pseudomonadota bacterium]|jgi:hypothetical protein
MILDLVGGPGAGVGKGIFREAGFGRGRTNGPTIIALTAGRRTFPKKENPAIRGDGGVRSREETGQKGQTAGSQCR